MIFWDFFSLFPGKCIDFFLEIVEILFSVFFSSGDFFLENVLNFFSGKTFDFSRENYLIFFSGKIKSEFFFFMKLTNIIRTAKDINR